MEKDKLMENKYYTPEIEEFHVGFEYEARSTFGTGTPWMKDTVRHAEQIAALRVNDPFKQGELRVKYLDRDCLESLGWKHDYNTEPIPNREELPVFDGYLFDKQNDTGELWILYHFSDNIVWVEYVKDCGGLGYIFKGEIKNKSELKRLMQWLKIF